ncbi:hypothetical protein [Arthrobacter sp. SPG23]|uniref:hypothetical protein n=1 Tax=Arthrobacter sp. SPG23 TaxID=1610703 RepID=UPI001364B6FB|nr:hypothetical protein [Arthrobacter sp. SPG23]
MTDALPSGAQLHEGVSLAMASGDFPESGADVTFRLDAPLAEDRVGTVVYWNPADQAWEPIESSLSADRLTLTSHVKHFSDYNWIESLYNGIGKVTGDKTDPPKCSGGVPEWADPSYSEDNINAPILWCVGTDGNNRDIMEVRLKMNRPSAGSLMTAIKPAWAWSDLWQNLSPLTWTQMAAQTATSSNQLGEKYLLQPLGEYRFGFDREQLMEFYSKNQNTPLIQVDSTITYTVAGLMYQAAEGKAAGNMAGVFIMTSLLECGGNLVGSAGESVPNAFGALLPCLNDRKDAIAVSSAKAWLKMNPAASWDESVAAGKRIGGVIRAAGGWYALIKGTYSIGAVIGDLTLDPFLRQLTFSPSLAEIKSQIEARKKAEGSFLDKTYESATQERYNNASQKFRMPYSFKHRSDWRVVPDQYGNLKVKDSAGQEIAALDFPLDFQPVRNMIAPVRLLQPPAVGSVDLKTSMNGCSPCQLRPYTFALDYREATPVAGQSLESYPVFDPKWDPPVRVMTILGNPSKPPTSMQLALVETVVNVESGDGNSAWFAWRAVKSFASMGEAEAWMKTSDRIAVEQMIMSLQVD